MRGANQLNRNYIGIDINPDYVETAKKRLSEPFKGFDSIDERMKRLPSDLNDQNFREEYIRNHLNWFLKNDPEAAADFIRRAEKKYSDEQISLFT